MKNKKQVSSSLINAGMIPVFYHADIEICKRVIAACYEGGIRVFEYTNRGEKALENFPLLKAYIGAKFPDMLLGIGSIITTIHAHQFIALDADFIVAPILDEEVAAICAEKDKFWIPGCGTLSEMARAEKLGAEIVKAFPGNVLGPGFVKAVRGPMPWLKIMPTGGVEPTEESLKVWFDAGVVCVGMGSQLITKDVIANGNYAALTQKVKDGFKIIEKLKNA